MKQSSVNVFSNSFFTQACLEAMKKHEEKDSQALLGLAKLLKNMTQTISQAASGGPSTSTSTPTAASPSSSSPLQQSASFSDVPTSEQIAAQLAALAQIMGTLKTDIGAATNSSYANLLKIQYAQMEEAVHILTTMQAIEAIATQIEQASTQGTQALLNEIQSLLNQYQGTSGPQAAALVSVLKNLQSYVTTAVNDAGNCDWSAANYRVPMVLFLCDQFTKAFGITFPVNDNSSDGAKFNFAKQFGTSGDFIAYLMGKLSNGMSTYLQTALLVPANNATNIELETLDNPIIQTILFALKNGAQSSSQEVANLQNIMQSICQMLATIATAETDSGQDGPSNTLVIKMLSMMTSMMNQLEGQIAQTSSDKGSSDTQVAQAFAQQAQQALVKAQQQLAQIEQQEAEQKAMGIFEDVIMALVSAIVVVVSLGTGAVMMAAVAATMCVLQETGALTKLTNAIAKDIAADLVHDGVPAAQAQKDAQAIADAIVVVMVIIVTAGVGLASGVSTAVSTAATSTAKAVAEQAANEGIEMTAMGASRAADVAEETTSDLIPSMTQAAKQDAKSIIEKAFESIGKMNLFRSLSPLANLTISSGIQAVMSTNLTSDATVAVMTKENKSQTDIAHAEMIASIVTGIIGSIGMGLTTEAFSSSMQNATKVAIPSMRDFFTRFPMFFKTITLIQTYALGGMQVGANLAKGASKTVQAELELAMGDAEARQELMTEYEKVTDNGMQNSEKAFTGVLKGHEQIDQVVMQQMLSFEATFAQIFSQAV